MNLAGKTSANLMLANFQSADAGSYTCSVSNDVGTATTSPIGVSLANAFTDSMTLAGLNGANAAADYDFDKDGIPNLLEFILGSDPKTGGSNVLPSVKAPVATTSENMLVTYRRKIAAAGITQVIEYSANLLPPWTAAVHGQNGVIITTTPVDAATEEVTVSIPAADGKRFVKLKATR